MNIHEKKLMLHIAMGKTGTSALQDFFWENRKALEKDGLCCPTYGAVSHAHRLLSPHVPQHLAKHWQFKPVAKWAQALRKTPLYKVLLSSERIA